MKPDVVSASIKLAEGCAALRVILRDTLPQRVKEAAETIEDARGDGEQRSACAIRICKTVRESGQPLNPMVELLLLGVGFGVFEAELRP